MTALLPACSPSTTTESHQVTLPGASSASDTALYTCPMHPEVRQAGPGRCPSCGMDLEPVAEEASTTGVTMQFAATPANPKAGQPVMLRYRPVLTDDTSLPAELKIVHERPIHLIVVNRALTFFDHIHPEPVGTEGRYEVPYTFGRGDDYLLYADYSPVVAPHQTAQHELKVGPGSALPLPLHQDRFTATVDTYVLKLTRPKGEMAATPGRQSRYLMQITRGGRPLPEGELEDYLGAKAHVVMIHQPTMSYEHIHPDLHEGGSGFWLKPHSTAPGLYRMWLQFQTRGKVYTADFAFRMPAT